MIPIFDFRLWIFDFRVAGVALVFASVGGAGAQQPAAPQQPTTQPGPPAGQQPARPLKPAGNPAQRPPGPPAAGPPGAPSLQAPPPPDQMEVNGETWQLRADDTIVGTNVTITYGEYTLTGGHLEGNVDRELVLTGNPTLTFRGQTLTGDVVRFSPPSRSYRIENLHTALTPEFLHGRLLTPLYLSADEVYGTRRQPIFGSVVDATTCLYPDPHYFIRSGGVKVEPGKRAILKHASIYLFGHRLLTLGTLVIPLDQRPRQLRYSHLPYVGRSADEGWFAKSTFDYILADRAPGLLRFDLMQKKGVGLGVDQAWNLLKAAGAFALYAIPTGGSTKNLTGRLSNRQNIGGGQTLTLDNDFQQNSYLALPGTTTFNTRFGYARNWQGASTTLNLSRMANDSGGSQFSGATSTHNYAANFGQTLQLGQTGTVSFNADYSRFTTANFGTKDPTTGAVTGAFAQRTEQLSTRFEADQRASNYTLQLVANKNIPVGQRTGQSFFSGLEKLPELTLSNFRFTHGFLSDLPITFLVSAGKYSEGSFGTGTGGTTGAKVVQTDRAVTGFDLNNTHFALTHSTDLNVSGGFQQYFYGDDRYAQYILRNNTSLTQRWGRHSGVNFQYTYQKPEGSTPFRFDQQGQFHTLTADFGQLDDQRVQLTARVGYDFSAASFGGVSRPWQTLSANLLLRPVAWARFQSLYSFDPNTGQMVSATGDLRLRGRSDFALDLVGRFDPRVHKFGQVNAYLNLPIGPSWRVIALTQYNGYLGRFESRNLQIKHEWDCLEASLTYIDNPFGFRNDRQVFFTLRIKAFPFFQQFGVGQFGQAINPGVGSIY